jgi:hypothetical protein
MTMKNEDFKIRPMKKWELAQMYKPNVLRASAVRSLRRWITDCPGLERELDTTDYSPKNREFTAAQVEIIVQFLGRP